MRSGIWAIALALFSQSTSNADHVIVTAAVIITVSVMAMDILEWTNKKLD